MESKGNLLKHFVVKLILKSIIKCQMANSSLQTLRIRDIIKPDNANKIYDLFAFQLFVDKYAQAIPIHAVKPKSDKRS